MRENRTSGSIGGRWPEDPERRRGKDEKAHAQRLHDPPRTSNQRPTSLGQHGERVAVASERSKPTQIVTGPTTSGP
jgi:hypothetical protein